MNCINFMYVVFVCNRGFRYPAGYLLLLASTAWLLVFASKVALGTGFTGLNDSGIARDLALLPLACRLCVVICYMSFEQISVTSQLSKTFACNKSLTFAQSLWNIRGKCKAWILYLSVMD